MIYAIRKQAMSNIIAHVGFPKTATTYLQNQIFAKIKVGWFAGTR
jgi:hypothetical protein